MTPDVEPQSWAELAAARLPLELCNIGSLPEPLLCGSVEVPEERSDPDGRQLQLEVIVVPAQQPDPPQEAVWMFEGGPGGAVTQRAGGAIYSVDVRARDIVLADQRGTGGSASIDCALRAEATETAAGTLREMYPPDRLAACVRELELRADLVRYTSIDHARDVEDLRRALGYEGLHLRGGSYGSRAMMVYAQMYPERVRSLFGIGVDAPLHSNLSERGASADQALASLGELCALDRVCRQLTPDLHQAVSQALSELDETPPDQRKVELDHRFATERLSSTGGAFSVDLGRPWLAEQLRLVIYFAFTSKALPWALHRALEADDWQPLAALALSMEKMFSDTLSTGVALTVQCSENMHFDQVAALEKEQRTLFGDYRLRQQIQGCAHWPHAEVPPLGVAEPAVLDHPALFLSGAHDPVTPPRYAEAARQLFPNSRHVVLREGQHGPFDLEGGAWQCVHAMWAQLIDTADVAAIDDSCAKDLRRPPWVADEEQFWAVLAEELLPEG